MLFPNIDFIALVANSFFFISSSGNQTVYDFTKTQNDLAEEFIQSYKTSDGNSSVRDKIWDVLDSISDLRISPYKPPEKFGSRYFFYDSPKGLFMRESLNSPEEIQLLNKTQPWWYEISRDGNLMFYTTILGRIMLQAVKNTTSGQDIETVYAHEHALSWNKDSTAFIYIRRGKPQQGQNVKICFHQIGTNQSSDVFVADLSPVENYETVIGYFKLKLTSDDKYMVLKKRTDSADEYLYAEYECGNSNWKSLKTLNKQSKQFLEYLDSDKTHPNIIYAKVSNFTSYPGEVVILKIDLKSEPVTEEIIADGEKGPYKNRVLMDACISNGDKLVLVYIDYLNEMHPEKGILEVKDLKTLTTFYKKTEVASKFKISCSANEVLIEKSVTGLPKIYSVMDFSKSPLEMVEFNIAIQPQAEVLEKLRNYETAVETYTTKDGSKLPIYIVHKKDFVPQGNSPVVVMLKMDIIRNILATSEIAFLGMFDGILAIPVFPESRLTTDGEVDGQTSLDDVLSSVAYLIERNYTSTGKIFLKHSDYDYDYVQDVNIQMALLTRPELFAGASISSRVFDLVKSTNKTECLKSPVQDTGYCFNQTVLEETMRMSPLHNIKQGVKYPPQLIRYRPEFKVEVHEYLQQMTETSEGSPVFITTVGSEYQWMLSAETKNPGNADALAFAAKVLGLSWKL